MNDLWMQGYAAGTGRYDWLRAVAGRFLRSWERAALAAGWREGVADADSYRTDMLAGAFVCDDVIPY